jgi:hypothetical protein
MAIELHTVEQVPGTGLANHDRVILGAIPGLATPAGGGAGAAVSVVVSGLSLPANYSVSVMPSQDAVPFVTAKTGAGFTITLNPRLAANTLAVGTVDVLIVG